MRRWLDRGSGCSRPDLSDALQIGAEVYDGDVAESSTVFAQVVEQCAVVGVEGKAEDH